MRNRGQSRGKEGATAESMGGATVTAREYQKHLIGALTATIPEVKPEWAVARDATDSYTNPANARYAPQLDIAIGPFNISRDVDANVNEICRASGHNLINHIRSRGVSFENENPRCLLAIEIEFTGSSKHILGGITNASMMGLVGIVIGRSDNIAKIHRIQEYVRWLPQVRKAPMSLFGNVVIFEATPFLELVADIRPRDRRRT